MSIYWFRSVLLHRRSGSAVRRALHRGSGRHSRAAREGHGGVGRLPGRDRLSIRERLALLIPRSNGLSPGPSNVHHHYDLGNDFYQLWLDRQLVYTCALFDSPESTLEAAQVAKLDLVCRKLQLQPGDTVVEAGCGWGALAMHMARHYGARVKAFNISQEQIRFARERAPRSSSSIASNSSRTTTAMSPALRCLRIGRHAGTRWPPMTFPSLGSAIKRVLKPQTGRGQLHFIGRDRPRPPECVDRSPESFPERMLRPWRRSCTTCSSRRTSQCTISRICACTTHGPSNTGGRASADPSARSARNSATRSTAPGISTSPHRKRAFVIGSLQLFQIVFAPSGRSPLYAAQPFPEATTAP